ncbi:hypothetical protein EC991_002864, partial [Linnemannia zychae]
MPLSAKTALIGAKPHIDTARQARSTKDIIKHYQNAKNILANVDAEKEDIHSLKEMIDAFHELAAVLNAAGPVTQDRALKCKQRADALEQELNRIKAKIPAVAMSLVGVPLAFSSLLNSAATTVTVANNSAAASPTTSTRNVVSPAICLSQQQPRSTPITPFLFSKKANCKTVGYHLPAPGEQLETTRQLAYCLALLQDSIEETCLDPDALKWRHNTLKNSDENIRVDAIARQLVIEFDGSKKDDAAVEEVIQLAQVLHKVPHRDLLMSLVDKVKDSTLLHYHAMEGLARVIQCATPGSINSDDLVSILKVLDKRLQAIHTSSANRITLHGPLTARLQEFKSYRNHCVAFQAEYAIQALLNVSDNDTIWQAGFRRGWLVLNWVAGFAKMPDPKEIKDVLEKLEKVYEAGKGVVRMLDNTLVAIKTSEKPTFNAKEGLKFKRIWYQTLRNAEEFIQAGDLVGFKELADGVWKREKEVEQVIFDMISILAINQGTDFEAVNALQKMMQQQNLALTPSTNLQSHPWYDFLSANPTSNATPTSNLLTAVQNKKQHEEREKATHSGVEYIANQLRPSQSSLKDIESALKSYHAPNLNIPSFLEKNLMIDTCFINLAIVEASAQRDKEKQKLKKQAAVFHRIPSSEAVKGSNIALSIRLEQLFDKRKLCNGKDGIPQKILVQGRAGIGKTTLCKKIVHLHQSELWADRFEAVLWLPLRRLRGSTSRTLENLLRDKVLFILDGLDEIVIDAQSEDSSIKALLRKLLDQKQVVVTSRPSGIDASLLQSIDLELETIGFSQQDVKDFIGRILEPGPARTVQDFIQRTPLIHGLVNIPVQLDVICFCWEPLLKDGFEPTMTTLYQLLMNHLGFLAFRGLLNNYQIEFDHKSLLNTFSDLKDYRKKLGNETTAARLLNDLKKTSFLHAADADLDPNKKNSQQTWSFLHLTFQEYFAATWIASKMMANGDDGLNLSAGLMEIVPTVLFVQEHKYDPRFEIVWWMVAGLLKREALGKFFDLLQGEPRDLIGGRHQQLLASCLHEARSQLAPAIVAEYDLELTKWLKFEMQTCQHDRDSISRLGSQHSFPEVILLESLGPDCPWKSILMDTLGARSTLSDSAIQFLIDALKDDDTYLRSSAALSLYKQSTLSEPALMSIFAVLNNEDGSPAPSVVCSQFSLSESEIQTFIDKLKNIQNQEDERVREALRQCEITVFFEQFELSNLASQSLTDALEDEDEDVVKAAVLELRCLSTLKHSVMTSLNGIIVEEDPDWDEDSFGDADEYAFWDQKKDAAKIEYDIWEEEEYAFWKHKDLAASVLGNKTSLSESATRFLIAAVKNGENYADRTLASWVLRSQSSLSESAIPLLIAALKDEYELVRYTASRVLCSQTSLSEPAIHLLIAALKDEEEYV